MGLSRHHGTRGASILELAFIFPVLAVLVLGVLDLGRAYRLQIRLDGAAGAGATHAILHPNDVDCTGDDDIVGHAGGTDAKLPAEPDYAVRVLAEDGGGALTVPVTGCGGTEVETGERVRVEIDATLVILTPLIGSIVGDALSLTGSAEVEAQ